MKRLVEGFCVPKHTIHFPHVGHVPIVERLVERHCAKKHSIHIRHVGHVPLVERLVEITIVSYFFLMTSKRRNTKEREAAGWNFLRTVRVLA